MTSARRERENAGEGTRNPLRVGTPFRLMKDVAACPCLSFHCGDASLRSGPPLIAGQPEKPNRRLAHSQLAIAADDN